MRGVVIGGYVLLTVALAVSANIVATQQTDDRLVSHVVLWLVSAAVGIVATILAWFGATRFETLVLGLLVLNALINLVTTVSIGPDSVLATSTYGLGEAAICAVPLLVISFVIRRRRARSPMA